MIRSLILKIRNSAQYTLTGSAYATLSHMGKTLSASMALAELTNQSELVVAKKRDYLDEMAVRDEMIRDCRAVGIPYATLMRRTGLSRDRLIKIAQTPTTESVDAEAV